MLPNTKILQIWGNILKTKVWFENLLNYVTLAYTIAQYPIKKVIPKFMSWKPGQFNMAYEQV